MVAEPLGPVHPWSARCWPMVNVGARAGVVGKAIPVKATQALADAFASMTVSPHRRQRARRAGQRRATATLGNPLNAAIWLARDLAASGVPLLKRGDLLSLGCLHHLAAAAQAGPGGEGDLRGACPANPG